MIRKLIPLVALVLSGSAMAQIGIGTKKAANSAQLDIVAAKKGVLLPRVQLDTSTNYAPIEGERVESLLVYHIGNANLEAGFYYWKSNAWTPLLSGDTVIDRKNNTFTIGGNPTKNGEESLIITDTENHSVYLSIAAIANNSTFITNLVENNEFVTKLGDNIDFINHITNNNEFIENIINELKNTYGNVNYDSTTNKFYYFDENGDKHEIDWSALNTTNVSFTLVGDHLVVADSAGNSVSLAVSEIANNSTFITNLVENQEFITKLGDNIEFIEHITNNNKFIEEIINNLKGTYGNVNYDSTTNKFFYYDENGVKHEIDWSALNTTNVSFTLDNDHLVVTDSNNDSVRLAVSEIANNSTFITNLVENQEFVTKLGDNIEFIKHITENNEFIENIIKELKGTYGNVSFDSTTNKFFYYDENGVKHEIDWSALNTTNISFTLDNDHLVVTDSNNDSVRLAVSEIANNSTFITNLVENQEFVTKLGDNIEFIKHITENNEFIENIIKELKGTYGNVSFDTVNNKFYYFDENGDKHEIDWSALNTTNISFTLDNDHLVVTDSNNDSVRLAVSEIANNSTFITNLVENQEFVTKLGDNIEFIKHITENNEFIENIIKELKGTYGNVSFDSTTNKFFYYDENGVKHEIDWSALNTTNVSFTLDNDYLVVTDSNNDSVRLAVTELANNKTFVENIAVNQDFITKLGDNIEFIKHITENNEFIENIIKELKGTYGNVSFDTVNNKFYYFDENGDKQDIDWSALNTTNVSFTLDNDYLVVTDSNNDSVRLAVTELANNKTFVENIAVNQDFITKLGDNIEFIKHITENNEFIENIIKELKGTYGNVSFDTVNNKFYYFDENGDKQDIDWSALNTTNVSFTLDNDYLVVTDSNNDSVRLAVTELANNKTFVENIAVNQDFITKLGDNIEFIKHITENNEFIENIIKELKGTYGNVSFDTVNNKFYYFDENGDKQDIDWSALNTTNVSFTLDNDYLVVTDSNNDSVRLAVSEIANNSTFITNLVENQEFVTKLGDNIEFIKHITENNEFIENIIKELKGTYGNVSFDTVNNKFYYFDENGDKQDIDWSALNTTNVSFTLDNDYLVVTDSNNDSVRLAVTELANNKTFVENIAVNQDFITKLGDNIEFIKHITENNEFIENIIKELKGTYGNVSFDTVNNKFYYFDENGDKQDIDWSALNTTNVSFTLDNDYLVVTDSNNDSVRLAVTELANNKTFVENIAVNQDFITKLGDNIEFIKHITENNEFIENIIKELKGTYGNVSFDTVNNKFYYFDENGDKQDIDWSALNTTNVSFTLDNDYLVVTDSNNDSVRLAVTELANNKTFVENIAVNQDFITKLGDNIEFIKHITENNEFIENIIKELKGTYGNVSFDTVNNKFYYFDENGDKQDIDWSALNTTNVSFTLDNDYLVVTDSNNDSVRLAVSEIANNSTFITNLVENQEFVTKLGDNIEFIKHITENNEFIENIIKELKGTYGNVSFDTVNNKFYYFDENGDKQDIDWSALNTTNVSFTLDNDYLVVTDSNNDSVRLAVSEIANNSTFITNLVENQEFVTKLGDNIEFIKHITENNEFIENIIKELKGTYGNVSFDTVNNKFYYFDENGDKQDIDWSALNTTNVSFTLDNDYLVVTDSNNDSVRLAVTELANNKTFVENIAVNQDFITKLGDNIEFIKHITENNEFIENIIKELKGTYGNVSFDTVNNKFYYFDENGDKQDIDWSALNTTNVSFTLDNDYLVVTDSNNDSVRLAVSEIANNSTFITNLVENQEFVTKLGDNIEFIKHITENNEFIENIIKELKGTYGNVSFDTVNNKFYYFDENGDKQDIDWSALNTTNVSFTLDNDYLVVTDSNNDSVRLAVSEIANNSTFITNLVENQEFVTKLGDNIEFIKHITENNEFIENIIKELKGTYGNVSFDTVNNKFYYFDENGDKQNIDWSALNTTNVSFTLDNDYLVVTDSNNDSVRLAVTELANNKTFVENIAVNQDFITKLGDNIEFIKHITENNEFIENIIKELKGTYGNVSFDTVNNKFYYFDENGDKQDIDWSALNTTNVSFTLDQDYLVITDSSGDKVRLAVSAIVSNDTFVTEIINKLKGKYGNVFYDASTDQYFYIKSDGTKEEVDLGSVSLAGDVTGAAGATRLSQIQGNPLDTSAVVSGQSLVFDGTQWIPSTPEVDVTQLINAQSLLAADASIVVDGINSILKETSIKVGSESITTSHIKNGTILPEDLAASPMANQILVTDNNSLAGWVDLSLMATSPWMIQGTSTNATLNTQNIFQTGTVAIGANAIPSTEPTAKLYVAGDVVTSGKYFTTNAVYADYVFEKYFTGSSDIKLTYEFNSLTDVANFVKENHHLPGVTPISELSKNEGGYGFDLTNLSVELLEKVEELFLHTIEQQDKIEQLNKEQENSSKLLEDTRKRLEILEQLIDKSINNSK